MNTDNTKERATPYAAWGRRDQLIVGTFLQSVFWFLALSIYSYVRVMPVEFTFHSKLNVCDNAENWMGSIGCHLAHYLVYELAGMVAFLFPLLPFWLSISLFFRKRNSNILKGIATISFLISWSAMALSYFHYAHKNTSSQWYLYPGKYGMEMMHTLGSLLGGGVVLLLATSLISVIILLNFKYLAVWKSLRTRKRGKDKKTSHHATTKSKKEEDSKVSSLKTSSSSTISTPLWHEKTLEDKKNNHEATNHPSENLSK
ncbi:MAG: DNA translocase FtsK 4TM domain-containing protein [Bacteroidota bacterium]